MNHNDYLEAERRIFPLWEIARDGKCGCGDEHCKAVGKHPRISNWQHSPNWSDEQIEAMESIGQLSTGFGVCIDDHLVIDIDPRNGGDASYDKLCRDTGLDFEDLSGHVVATGGGGRHIEFNRPHGVALVQHLNGYPGIDFKSSGYVVGSGSIHASGAVYETIKGYPDELTDAPAALIELLRKPEYHRASVSGTHVDVSDDDLSGMVTAIDPDCEHDMWVNVGMALHHTTNGEGFAIWDAWSNEGKKYPGRHELEKRWHSFGKCQNPVTIGTLIHFAESYGYQRPVTIPADEMEEAPEGHPFPIDTVDALRPPGFVGEVTTWINSQCRFPREHLAVAAALTSLGNIVGLRHVDDKDGVTANLFSFCVSASGTGKEAVQQASTEIHRAAGIQAAVHGSIKSEQEVVRNLVRHQAAFYVVDELGFLLRKIANAQKTGGAAYLDGVIGILMSAYSKASGFMLLTGDMKDEVRNNLARELAQCRKAVAENEDTSGHMQRRIPQIEQALQQIDMGLERPFLSMMGFTTPVTFDDLVTAEQATNGFIGRSLLIREKETNPKRKRGFKKQPMPEAMRATLQNLYSPGAFDMQGDMRVEYYGEPVRIKTEPKAVDMLERVADWIEDYAEDHKGKTGLEAIVRRGYELCAKISLILAVPEGIRTAEHVRWAYAIMRRDIDEKIALAYSNMLEGRKDTNSQGEALASRILGLVDERDGETIAVLANRNRKYSRDDVQAMVDHLVSVGQLVVREVEHPRNGRRIAKYFRPQA